MHFNLVANTSTVVLFNQQTPRAIAADTTNLYWNSTVLQTVVEAPLASPSTTRTLLSGVVALGLASDGSNLYWTAQNGSIMTVALGSLIGTPTAIATSQAAPYGIAVDATTLYWANSSDGSIQSVAKTGGSPRPIATGQAAPRAVAVDAVSVLWSTAGGAIYRIAK
jgi:hypothetical protein